MLINFSYFKYYEIIRLHYINKIMIFSIILQYCLENKYIYMHFNFHVLDNIIF